MDEIGTVTLLLERIRQGERNLVDELAAVIYPHLHQNARRLRQGERPGHSLLAEDLVQLGFLRLLREGEFAKAENRRQLQWAFSRAVRQVLVDHARKRLSTKGGQGAKRFCLDEVCEWLEEKSRIPFLPLHESLADLEKEFPEEAKVLEMHYFGNYTLPEIATILGVSLSTIERCHRFAKDWLKVRLKTEEDS